MSSNISALELTADDARKILVAKSTLGSANCNYQMEQYVYKKNSSGSHIINIQKMWEKIILAARIIAAVENPEDVCVVSTKEMGHRAILKFARFCGTTSTSGRFSPGTFTNHSQGGYREPKLIIVTDPAIDHQAVREASYVNIPIIGLCDVDSPLKYIDVVIPCNNKGKDSVGLVWWILAREVLRLKGQLSRTEEWEVMPDLFFYRNAEDIKRQEQEDQKKIEEANQQEEVHEQGEYGADQGEDWNQDANNNFDNANPDWADETGADNQDWAAENTAAQQWA